MVIHIYIYLKRVLDGHALLQPLEPLGVDYRRLLVVRRVLFVVVDRYVCVHIYIYVCVCVCHVDGWVVRRVLFSSIGTCMCMCVLSC
jgi:hypothetical protein